MAALTAGVLRWHLDYFRSPGPQYYRMMLLFVPAVVLLAWLYSAARRAGIWRWELHAFAILTAGACLAYEPRAFAVLVVFLWSSSAVGSFALGRLGLKLSGPLERITVSFGAGAGLFSAVLVVCGTLRLFYGVTFIAALALPLVLCWREARQTLLDIGVLFERWRSSPAVRHPLAGVAVVFGFAAAVCGLMLALAPSVAFDPVAMHLPSVQFYALAHALRPVPGIDYSYYPQGFEMLWTLAYGLAGQAGAQLMSALFFPLFLMLLARLARECGLDPGAALLAIVCTATLPFLHWTASAMKNDIPLAFFELLALYSFIRWLDDRNFRWIVAGSFFLAQAFSIKHVALFGAIPLLLMLGYAVAQQRKPWRSAAVVVFILLILAGPWFLRAYLLTGNPVAPATLRNASGYIGHPPPPPATRALRLLDTPRKVLFQGTDAFESPLPNPMGLLFFAFGPLALLGVRVIPRTRPQVACLVFAGVYLFYWAFTLVILRYAVAAFALLAVLAAGWMQSFYDRKGAGHAVKLSLIGAETYCLLVALMGLMIVGINGPQFSYFAGRLDKREYLRAAMQAYGAVEYLDHIHANDAAVFAVENLARIYAPNPFQFQAMWCPSNARCKPEAVALNTQRNQADYLILPENGRVPPEALAQLGNPERVYRDAYFSVYHLTRDTRQALR